MQASDRWRLVPLELAAAVLGAAGLAVMHASGWAVPGNIWWYVAFTIGGTGLLRWAQRRPGSEAYEQALAVSEDRFRTILQDSNDITLIIDRNGVTTFVSSGVRQVMGFTVEQYIERQYDLIHPDDIEAVADLFAGLNGGAAQQSLELRLLHADGDWRWHEVNGRNLLGNPSVQGLVFNHRDITARKKNEQRLAYEAAHDPLTGLANRATLHEKLTAWCSGETRSTLGALLYLDLDGFKQVNDELGHAAGDELLLFTAQALRESVLGSDLVARLGGDEFVVLLTEVGAERDAETVAARILDRLAGAAMLAGHAVTVRASIGITAMRPGRTTAATALHEADTAMYAAKRQGTGSWHHERNASLSR